MFTIIIFLAIFCFILYKIQENSDKNEEIINEIKNKYQKLNDIILESYDIKKCPKCHENKMTLISVSSSGSSIEYICDNCKKKIISQLLPEKEGSFAVSKFNAIKYLFQELINRSANAYSKRNLDISFIVNTAEFKENIQDKRLRTAIPESVKHEVWRRDLGQCVLCGSKLNLEFDHIIPFSKGGANTVRNLQLLCEICNRRKYNNI